MLNRNGCSRRTVKEWSYCNELCEEQYNTYCCSTILSRSESRWNISAKKLDGAKRHWQIIMKNYLEWPWFLSRQPTQVSNALVILGLYYLNQTSKKQEGEVSKGKQQLWNTLERSKQRSNSVGAPSVIAEKVLTVFGYTAGEKWVMIKSITWNHWWNTYPTGVFPLQKKRTEDALTAHQSHRNEDLE